MQYYKEREEKIDFRLRFHQENWKNTAALNSLLLQTHIPSQAVEVDGAKHNWAKLQYKRWANKPKESGLIHKRPSN